MVSNQIMLLMSKPLRKKETFVVDLISLIALALTPCSPVFSLIFTAKEKSIEAFLLNEKIILLKKLIQDFNEERTLKLLKELVPEWKERN